MANYLALFPSVNTTMSQPSQRDAIGGTVLYCNSHQASIWFINLNDGAKEEILPQLKGQVETDGL